MGLHDAPRHREPESRAAPRRVRFAALRGEKRLEHVRQIGRADAVAGVTGVPTKFDDYPEIKKAILLPNEKGRSDFLDMFGRSSRDTPCECETSLAPNLSQVLYLLHSEELQRKLADKDGLCTQLAKSGKPSDETVDEIFLRTFSRLPRPEERAEAVSLLDTAKEKQPVIEDLVWTLMNSKEFLFSR